MTTTQTQPDRPKFKPGRIVSTPRALTAITAAQQSPIEFVMRHLRGDWGEAYEEDQQMNEEALESGNRIMSVYRTQQGERLWVITEADRSATTLLLPDEY
jgi:hypothetical protein